ncbi:EamA family transporter [Ochrobactrum sp. P6BS-III]|uniref:DMT family transporter n=1 Tax=unclassified Ochrobactrum TaxID=239106 RepID=UPI000991ADFF|nr:drug/metabolite transporter (DMT)-like permease [Ochrobactrum sp. P6BSIII]OOL14713.1 EamA family transporter [Ochrobactrum sp. P6BS-III]
MKLMESASFLLLATGTLLGLILPLGKIAAQVGIPPAMWTFLFSASAGVILFAVLLLRGKSLGFSGGRARYYVCTAIISYALPNLLILSAIPRLGAGFTGIMYTLSPVITLVISIGFGLRRPNALGIGGIAVGFIGAILVALTRGEVGKPADPLWVAAALLIPVFLACGNVYRTLDWPKNSDPTELAAGSHLASAIMLFAGILLFTGGFPVETFALAPWAATAQAIASAGMFALFFRLQAVGGPVYLSQIGYVAAALGLISGTLFLGEHYPLLTWIGAAVIAVGVAMTTRAQKS